MKCAPVFVLEKKVNVVEERFLLLSFLDSYYGRQDVRDSNGFLLQLPRQHIPTQLLKNWMDFRVGEITSYSFRYVCDGVWRMDNEEVLLIPSTFAEYDSRFRPVDRPISEDLIDALISTHAVTTMSYSYSSLVRLATSSMVSAYNFSHPVVEDWNTGVRSKWGISTGVLSSELLLSIGVTITGFHIDAGGFSAMGNLLVGGVKIWIIVAPFATDLLIECLNKVANQKKTAQVCMGMLNCRAYMVNLAWLRRHSISYSIAVQREGDIVVVLPNAAHAVLTIPFHEAGFAAMDAVNFNFPRPDAVRRDWKVSSVRNKCPCVPPHLDLHETQMLEAFPKERVYRSVLECARYMGGISSLSHTGSFLDGLGQAVVHRIDVADQLGLNCAAFRALLRGLGLAQTGALQNGALCGVCTKSFASQKSLNQHMLLHAGTLPHKCNCGAGFNLYEKLCRHREAKKSILCAL